MPNWDRDEYYEHVGDRWEDERDWSPTDREDELGIYDDDEEEEG